MTTTLNLDDHLTRQIEQFAKQHQLTFEQALKQTIQQGLSDLKTEPEQPREPFRQKTFDMGSFEHVRYDKTSQILAENCNDDVASGSPLLEGEGLGVRANRHQKKVPYE